MLTPIGLEDSAPQINPPKMGTLVREYMVNVAIPFQESHRPARVLYGHWLVAEGISNALDCLCSKFRTCAVSDRTDLRGITTEGAHNYSRAEIVAELTRVKGRGEFYDLIFIPPGEDLLDLIEELNEIEPRTAVVVACMWAEPQKIAELAAAGLNLFRPEDRDFSFKMDALIEKALTSEGIQRLARK